MRRRRMVIVIVMTVSISIPQTGVQWAFLPCRGVPVAQVPVQDCPPEGNPEVSNPEGLRCSWWSIPVTFWGWATPLFRPILWLSDPSLNDEQCSLNMFGRGCRNRRSQNPGIAKKGGGSDPCQDFLKKRAREKKREKRKERKRENKREQERKKREKR